MPWSTPAGRRQQTITDVWPLDELGAHQVDVPALPAHVTDGAWREGHPDLDGLVPKGRARQVPPIRLRKQEPEIVGRFTRACSPGPAAMKRRPVIRVARAVDGWLRGGA